MGKGFIFPFGRWFVLVWGPVLLVGTAAGAESNERSNRFNVLLIAVDDLRPELGCYGASYAPSPNLDRLAQQGIVFSNHFVQVATCGASRFSLLTGRSPARSGVTQGNHAFCQGATALLPHSPDGAQSLPELFRTSGYRTVCIGKLSHMPDGKVFDYQGRGDGRAELPNAWDELATPYGAWKRGWGAFFAYAGGRHREDGQGHRDVMEFVADDDEDLPDGLMARTAIDKLEALKQTRQPFFLGLGFFKPHLPFVATKQDWQAMADADVPPPPHPQKPATAYWHGSGEFYGYTMPFPKRKPLRAPDQDRTRRAYLACVRYVDRQIGKVLDALDELGLAESTIVVVWGDHGWHLGDSQIWGKHTPFERAMHSPLIIRVPGMANAGRRCDALVETLDIYPTLLDLCRPAVTETAHPLNGRSLRPLIENPNGAGREAAISYWKNAVSVRTKTHRLIAARNGGEWTQIELYDLRDGADPINNVAESEPDLVKSLLRYIPQDNQRERKEKQSR